MDKIAKGIITGAMALSLIAGGIAVNDKPDKCPKDQPLTLDQTDEKGKVQKRFCTDEASYANIKEALLNEWNEKQAFDINDREILFLVLNKEIETKGLDLTGTKDKEEIRDKLIDLLK